MTPAQQAPTAGQAAAASPGVSAPGSFLTAGPMDGQPGLGVPGRGLAPSAADVRVVSPASVEYVLRPWQQAALDALDVKPIPFPARPWRAADTESNDPRHGTYGVSVSEIRSLLKYDPVSGDFFWLTGKKKSRRAGVDKGNGYRYIEVNGRRCRAHVLAFAHFHGVWPEEFIDHIDGNGSNNAIANLRDVSRAVNAQNRRDVKRNTGGGYLGVRLDKRDGKFEAQIFAKGKRHYIGRFQTAEAAHEAYIAAKRQLHEGCTL